LSRTRQAFLLLPANIITKKKKKQQFCLIECLRFTYNFVSSISCYTGKCLVYVLNYLTNCAMYAFFGVCITRAYFSTKDFVDINNTLVNTGTKITLSIFN
jgi:hypothetical protein